MARGQRVRSGLTREALDRFLACLDSDRERAGEKYELLRRKLMRLFECRGRASPESLADQALDRAARRLDEVEIRDVTLYVFGIARYVLKESQRSAAVDMVLEHLPPAQLPRLDPREDDKRIAERLLWERRLDCLEQCMRALPAEHRRLVTDYYQKSKAEKVEHRRRMAEQLGVSPEALRVQMHRIRVRLEECVRRRLAEFTQ